MGESSSIRAEPKTVIAGPSVARASNPSTNSARIRRARHGSVFRDGGGALGGGGAPRRVEEAVPCDLVAAGRKSVAEPDERDPQEALVRQEPSGKIGPVHPPGPDAGVRPDPSRR